MADTIKRGEIYAAEIDGKGHEQKGYLPVLIIQNDIGNAVSPTTIVVTLTKDNGYLPTHFTLKCDERVSTIKCEHIRTVDKSRLKKKLGQVNDTDMQNVSKKIMVSLGI